MRVLLIEGGKVAGEFYGATVQELTASNPGALFVADTSGLPRVIGMDYADGVLSGEPTPDPAPAPGLRHITQLAFLTRFTDAEAVAIDLASIGATVPAASMRRYLDKVRAATFIDLDRADTRAGVQALESAGLLDADRALEILDAPIQPGERPL